MKGLSLKPPVGLDQVKSVITESLCAAHTAASDWEGRRPDAPGAGTLLFAQGLGSGTGRAFIFCVTLSKLPKLPSAPRPQLSSIYNMSRWLGRAGHCPSLAPPPGQELPLLKAITVSNTGGSGFTQWWGRLPAQGC